MLKARDDIQIPVIVESCKDGKADIFIPDLSLTIHGTDFVDGLAKASLRGSAIYYYNKERNLPIALNTTYDEAQQICDERFSKNAFVAYVCFTN